MYFMLLCLQADQVGPQPHIQQNLPRYPAGLTFEPTADFVLLCLQVDQVRAGAQLAAVLASLHAGLELSIWQQTIRTQSLCAG